MTAITGTYDLKIQTPMGEKHATLVLEADKNTLSGSFVTKSDTSSISGTTTGNQIDFETVITTPLGKITARIIGSIEGDNLIAESKLMFATAKISGIRRITSV